MICELSARARNREQVSKPAAASELRAGGPNRGYPCIGLAGAKLAPGTWLVMAGCHKPGNHLQVTPFVEIYRCQPLIHQPRAARALIALAL